MGSLSMVLWVEHLVLGLPYLHVGEELRLCLSKYGEFIVFGFGIEARALGVWRQGISTRTLIHVVLQLLVVCIVIIKEEKCCCKKE